MNKHEVMVAEFINTFAASTDVHFWTTMVTEEADEFEEAVRNETREQHLKECVDLAYVYTAFVLVVESLGPFLVNEELTEATFDRINEIDAKYDWFVQENAEALDLAFERVHASNMSKLGVDGKPIRREDGKIMKGPNYAAPDLSDL